MTAHGKQGKQPQTRLHRHHRLLATPLYHPQIFIALTRPVLCVAAMYAAMAAPGNTDEQPQPTSNGIIGFVFYAAFIVICAFCLLNLYVGVIFSEFSKIRLLSTAGSAFLTTKQQVSTLC